MTLRAAKTVCWALSAAAAAMILPAAAFAEPTAPLISINTGSNAAQLGTNEVFTALKLSLILSSLVILPALFMTMTCFPRIAVVLALTRQALGTASTPPNQLILGLALFLTFAIMGHTFERVYQEALIPYSDDQLSNQEALKKGFAPIREFMLPHTREQDIELFLDITKTPSPKEPAELPASVVVPAFVVSELNTAFQIAFLIYVPFLILDMIISSVLTSMSMITLPPTVISLPIKLMLFVMIDGWSLIIGNLVNSYHG